MGWSLERIVWIAREGKREMQRRFISIAMLDVTKPYLKPPTIAAYLMNMPSRTAHIACQSPPMLITPTPVFSTLLFLLLFQLSSQSVSLRHNTLLSPLAGCLRFVALGLHLLLQDTLTLLFGLGLVDLWWISAEFNGRAQREHTCSTKARLCLNVLPLLKW